jgi:hypothetical protein
MGLRDGMKARLDYRGGPNQELRMHKDKVAGLKKALLYSYQAETAVLSDGREFRCLINPDKQSGDYDNKVISIPYSNICLTTGEEEEIGMKPGDVFQWKETDTYWLNYLEYIEENAYFRCQIRRCDQTTLVNGKEYHVYIRGPVETALTWAQKGGVEWNEMNHSLEMYITKDANTVDFFHRFSIIKVKEEITGREMNWQVVASNPYYADGIIKISLDEYFENPIEESVEAERKEALAEKEAIRLTEGSRIEGPIQVYQYSKVNYEALETSDDGEWLIKLENGQEKELNVKGSKLTLNINKIKGSFELIYRTFLEELTLEVEVLML